MNAAQIFQLIEQGLTVLPLLIQAGIDVSTRIEQLVSLSKAGKNGTPISDEELASIRAQFDADLDSFNSPIV